jgi:hypothetical protein
MIAMIYDDYFQIYTNHIQAIIRQHAPATFCFYSPLFGQASLTSWPVKTNAMTPADISTMIQSALSFVIRSSQPHSTCVDT